MKNRRNWLYFAAGGFGLAAGLGYQFWPKPEQSEPVAAGPGPSNPNAPTSPSAQLGSDGEGFFELSFPRPNGQPLAMASFRGKPLLVNFWATWCPPCIEELPLIDDFFQKHAANGWQTVGLAVDQVPAVQKYLAAKPLHFPVAMAGLSGVELSRSLGNTTGALPFSLLFNRDGKLVQRKLGQLSEADLKTWAGL